MKFISNFHLLGIQFLFENFMKQRYGAILNQEEDMNMYLQVCMFFRSVKDKISEEKPVLIVSANASVCKWHYHISEVGFKPLIVSSENFDPCEIYLITLELLKSSGILDSLDMFCIVVDELDAIASKLILRKMKGDFKIGLTTRNFYTNPDQKLKWSMLNWANPGCVGKLNDFYRIDRLHSLAFADNYKFWWLRLTWKYCVSFEQPSDEEKEEYQQKLKKWGETHEINAYSIVEDNNLKRKRETKNKKPKKVVQKQEILTDIASISRISANNAPTNYIEGHEESKCAIDEPNLTQGSNSSCFEDKTKTGELFLAETKIEKNGSGEDTEIDDEDFDIFGAFKYSSKKRDKKSLESDDESPIISIINSQREFKSLKAKESSFDVKKLSQSDSDSEFLSDIVKNKDKTKSFRSQQLSFVLDNLSDKEESKMEILMKTAFSRNL
ncbi:hypothetical protein HHI36_015501 [Cryptolaemus montrouzieri]